MNKITHRVLVVDDYEAWRTFVVSTLQKEPDLRIIGEATDGLEAVQIGQQLQPDLIVLDIGMPVLNGIEAARRIREVSPNSKILFVTENRSRDIAQEALRTGAYGYVIKSDAATQLLPAMRAVLEGKEFVSTSLTGPTLDDPEDGYIEALPQSRMESHEIKFYPDHAPLVDDLAQFTETALNRGSAVVVVGTEPLRNGLRQRLRADGVDLHATAERKQFFSLDIFDPLTTAAFDEAVKAATQKGLHVAVG